MNLNRRLTSVIIAFVLMLIGNASIHASCLTPSSTEILANSTTASTTFKRILFNDVNDNCMDYANMRGRLIMIGTPALCAMDNSISTTECIDPNTKAETPSNINSGGCADDTATNDGCQNNDFKNGPDRAYLGLADYDDNPSYGVSSANAASSTTSTMAKLTLKSGDNVLYARLYWMGRMENDTAAAKSNIGTVKMLSPTSGSYQDVSCGRYNRIGSNYSCSADVKSLVKQSGDYWVANVKGREKNDNNFAAWSLVVVVQNDEDPFRNISMYEGFKSYYGSLEDPDQEIIDVSGFLTPIDTAAKLDATFHIFAGETDNGYGDSTEIQNKSANYNYITSTLSPNLPAQTVCIDWDSWRNRCREYKTFDPIYDLLNASITTNGSFVSNRLPAFSNALGIDVDTFDISSLLSHAQTSTKIRFSSTQDQIYVPFVAISTNIYEPKLCYDYAYSQNNRYFTEDHDGSTTIIPHVKGDVISGDPIVTKIQLRNMEENSVASDVYFNININDIENDASFGNYSAVNVQKTLPGGLSYTTVPSSDFTSQTATNRRFKFADSMPYDSATFTQFNIIPNKSTVDFPLDMSIDFTIKLSGIDPLQYKGYKLKDQIPLCSSNNFAYTVPWGIYSAVDSDIFTGTGKYNIGTQVAGRPFKADIVSFDPTNVNTLKAVQDYVAVELIDAGGFHDINTTCRDPQALTSRVWLPFGNFDSSGGKISDGNITKVPLNLDLAFNRGLISSSDRDTFFNVARENTALRVWTLVDNTGKKLDIKFSSSGTGGNNPKPDLSALGSWLTTSGCSTTCQSTSLTTGSAIKACMECLYAKGAYPLCSRDNFSIRPESYNVRLGDLNQTNLSLPSLPFATDRTGVTTALNSAQVPVAAGYLYDFDINATNHKSNDAVSGYTRYFSGLVGNSDYNATFLWNPSESKDTSGCNAILPQAQDIKLVNGRLAASEKQRKISDVGEYTFNIIDKTWTKVDWDDTRMVHHTGSNINYFIQGDDCIAGDSALSETQSSYVDGNYYKNGCDISSVHVNQSPTAAYQYKYADYNFNVLPYKFDMSTIKFGVGLLSQEVNATHPNFVYISDIGNTNDMNMAVRVNGTIAAKGYDDTNLSNFVSNCYAKNINLAMNSDANLTIPSIPFQYRFINTDNSSAVIYDSGAVDMTNANFLTVTDGNFTSGMNGSIGSHGNDSLLRFNFDRNQTTPQEAKKVHYTNFSTECSNVSECTMQANLIDTHQANGNIDMDFNVTHVYGRVISRNVRATIGSAFDAQAHYEVYNTSSLLGKTFSPDSFDADWYVNELHTDANFGDANVTAIDPTNGVTLPTHSMSADGVETYAFPAITVRQGYKAHINTEGWLWYGGVNALNYSDPANPGNLDCLTHPCFGISLGRIIGNTGSAKTESEAHKANKNTTSTGWSTTSEYAPAAK